MKYAGIFGITILNCSGGWPCKNNVPLSTTLSQNVMEEACWVSKRFFLKQCLVYKDTREEACRTLKKKKKTSNVPYRKIFRYIKK